jgi:hypothetical protein
MKANKTAFSTIAVAILAAATLAACGGSDATSTASTSPSALPSTAMASAMASDSMVGTDPGTWAPLMVRKGKTVTLVPGQIALVPALNYAKRPNIVAVSSDETVVEVLPNDPTSVVAFRAIAPGTATIQTYNGPVDAVGTKKLRKITVTVEAQ